MVKEAFILHLYYSMLDVRVALDKLKYWCGMWYVACVCVCLLLCLFVSVHVCMCLCDNVSVSVFV